LIPGAVVTVVAEVADDGDTDADDVRLRIALPPEAEPIPGSFSRDAVEIDAEALLGEGLRIGTVPAAGAIRLRFTVRILPGTEPLDLAAHAAAPGVPAIAGPALRLARRSGHTAYAAPRAFFELEAGETDDDLTAVAAEPPEPQRAIDTTIDEPAAPAVAHESEPFPELELPHEPEPEPALTSQVTTEPEPEAESLPELELPHEPEPEPAAEFVLARVLDADEVRALERVFSGAVPHGLAALALLSSIAAADGALGRALGISEFARAVSAALPRALVAARMNRPTPLVVTREALATIRPDAEPPHEDLAYEGPLLVARLEARDLDALRALLARALDDPFLRGVQVLLAVAPRALEGVPEHTELRARDALAAYRGAAGAWLMRVTVRRAVDRRYDPLTADDATLHEAGRALVTALREAMA
ncbi:MAG: hypothetical protein QOD51_1442, partial [Candidatus Eremiobacteraeota bacterium]|nr:hypothetical protein [Candidatus Eremiobacteraeota bacterium]